jgi:carbon storage regulator
MPILTRGPRQALKIGDDVTVTVLEIRGAQVRSGVSAPRDTPIVRVEVIEKARVVRRMRDAYP